ncbi:hypothetical protein [Myroides sp. LoEW2-1]|uniref:hypothetical protein n=1 Tax=Myroides sp. LoEW2-1 TaxID=2683192 RepID=UPI00132BCC84|nr:hypothetical protein [Myroides sp. LoEW2-1]MVX34437.1 hypothetical protein [Myroides sp. LoEW2-1]
MKKTLVLFTTIILITSCSKSDINNSNPYLPSQNVSLSIPLSYADNLRYPGGVYVDRSAQAGISGVAIYSSNGMNEYYSYELTCPNHHIQADGSSILIQDPTRKTFFYCTATHLHNGEKVYYDIATGAWGRPVGIKLEYALKAYPTKKQGDVIYVNY